MADEALAAVHRAGEAEIRGEERALGDGLGRGPREIGLARRGDHEPRRMVERLHGEIVGIHAHRRGLAGAEASHVDLIRLTFVCAPGDEGSAVRCRGHRHAREVDLVRFAGMLELETRTEDQLRRRRALRIGSERHESRGGRHHSESDQGRKRAGAHERLLYLIWNSTGNSTHMATGSLPRLAGSKRQRRTASTAAWSRSGWPAVCWTRTSPTRPSTSTWTLSRAVPWMPWRRALDG